MTEKKTSNDPNLVKATGSKLDRPLNEFERKVAAKLLNDPRFNDAAKLEVAEEIFPDTPAGIVGSVGENSSDFVPDPDTQAMLDTVLSDYEALQHSDAAKFAKGEDVVAAAATAADPLADDDEFQRLQFEASEKTMGAPVAEASPFDHIDKNAELLKEMTSTYDLPEAVTTSAEFTKVLDHYNLSNDQALSMLLDADKPISSEAKELLWQQELKAAELSEDEVNDAIHSFLSRGFVEITGNHYNGAITYTIRSRTPEADRLRDQKIAELLRSNDSYITPQLENKHSFLWKSAGSLQSFKGFGNKFMRDSTDNAIENAAAFLDNIPSVGFEFLAKAVQKLDNLSYFAAQKLAIENF